MAAGQSHGAAGDVTIGRWQLTHGIRASFPAGSPLQRVSVGREGVGGERPQNLQGTRGTLIPEDRGFEVGFSGWNRQWVNRVSAVATEHVSRASGEVSWWFNGEWEIGSVEGVGEGCQVGKRGWEFAGGSWGNLSRGIRGKRGNFVGARLGSSRRDSRAGVEAEVLRVGGRRGMGRRVERRADWFSGIFWRGRAWIGG